MANSRLPNGETKTTPVWPVLTALSIACAFWIGNFIYGSNLPTEQRGIFGDMFGAVNALFSGMAFVGVIYAISMQRIEITIAKKEILFTKQILSDQQEHLETQNKQSKIQAFESTFFQMLRLFTDITSQIDLHRTSSGTIITTKGKDVFPVFLKRFRKAYKPPATALYGGEDFQEAYEKFYKDHNSELGHYFRTIYNIIKFIENSDVENKNFYSNILRAQLSDAEAALLFYNCLSPNGSEKFKPLVEKFGLLKNVADVDIVDAKLREEYKGSAFGNKKSMSH